MGGKIGRKFAFESGSYYTTPIISRRDTRKRFRCSLLEDEVDYYADDEKEPSKRTLVDPPDAWSETEADSDAKESRSSSKKRKLKETASDMEKTMVPTNPDQQSQSTNEEKDLELFLIELCTANVEPPRQKWKLERTVLEKAALLAYPDPWSSHAAHEEELESIHAMLLTFTTGEEACM